jgi:hypothetical protein
VAMTKPIRTKSVHFTHWRMKIKLISMKMNELAS